MLEPKKSVWGYNIKEVNQFISKFKNLSEQELDYLQHQILNALKELALLNHDTRPLDSIHAHAIHEVSEDKLDNSENVENVESSDDVAVEDIVENEAVFKEVFEDAAAITEIAATASAPIAGMGRLIMFRRRFDTPIIPSNQESSKPITTNQKMSYGYWESIEQFLQSPVVIEDLIIEQPVFMNVSHQSHMNAASPAVGLPKYFDYSLPDSQVQAKVDSSQVFDRRTKGKVQESIVPVKLNKSVENANAAAKRNLSNSEAPANNQGSKEITREVRQLRYKYIVGKWAGEDLFDAKNKLIVKKNTVITEEIVDAAEQEGKLSLLIIHMILPGIGEDI
jgi:hypothetical protein